MEDDHKAALDKEQKQINRIYAAMVAMLIFSCVPVVVLQIIAFFLLIYVMLIAYALRARAAAESLAHNHMDYLIRTFWISSLFFLIGFAVAIVYLAQKLDLSAVTSMIGTLATGQIAMTPDIRLLATVSLLTMGPSMIYFIYRVAKGLSRAINGYRMANVKEWF